MSLSYQKLNVIEVRDPRTILENKRDYAILKGGSQVTYKRFTTNSVSSSSIQFSCPPPSGGIIVDRKMYALMPIRLTFAGTSPVGEVLLNPGQDAPRAFPLSSAIDTLQVSINNTSVSINMSDVIQALMRYNNDEKLASSDFSMTPNMLDQSQAYSQLFGSSRNPLGFYGDSGDQSITGRGGFPFRIVSNTNTAAVVDMVVCEPLFLSPFYWGNGNSSGFYNVTTMDFNFTFVGNAGNRMWSHDAVSTGVQTNITSISAQFNNFTGPAFSFSDSTPSLLFTYITPDATQVLPFDMPITYSYFNIERYPTGYNNAVAAGTTVQIASNNIQLNSVPRRMYIYARESNEYLNASPNNPDTYFSIESIDIQFENKSGLLAGANKRQLYEMSVKNHCNMSWEQWSGESLYKTGDFSNLIAGPGSVLCIEFATDIGLDSITAPGKLGQYMFQANVNVKNVSNRNIVPTLYVVSVAEGTFTISKLGAAETNIGVITSTDILEARQSPFLNYKDIEQVNGGNFLSGVKDFGKSILSGLKRWDQRAGRALDVLMEEIAPKIIGKLVNKTLGGPVGQSVLPNVASGVLVGGEVIGDGCMCDGQYMASGVGRGGISMGGSSRSKLMRRVRNI